MLVTSWVSEGYLHLQRALDDVDLRQTDLGLPQVFFDRGAAVFVELLQLVQQVGQLDDLHAVLQVVLLRAREAVAVHLTVSLVEREVSMTRDCFQAGEARQYRARFYQVGSKKLPGFV
jgi:hypothetical protein